MPLQQLRQEAADACFQAYNFGESIIEDADGWEFTTPGNEWTRMIYVQSENRSDPTCKGHFTVQFAENSAVITDAYGMLNGNVLTPPTPSI